MLKFGPAGNDQSFYDEGNKASIEMPKWLSSKGLDAYEYPCTRGVNIGVKTAEELGASAKKEGILLSVHAPYYINFGSTDAEGIKKSKNYLIETTKIAKTMGADRVVFHPGSCGKVERNKAFEITKRSIAEVIDELIKLNLYPDVIICPETMGKFGQIGSLDEILTICKMDDNIIPTIDFAHLHAISLGGLSSEAEFKKILDRIKEVLGDERGKKLHCHFSRVEFTNKGEKKHWTYGDIQFGPDIAHLLPSFVEEDVDARIICESRGNMAQDALIMKKHYIDYLNSLK